ncbi:hypothetical protein OCC_08018 [Thermococcus litoralis DSM 5473]|uniref:Site-specific integrase n=1 Tax=Thermococcus litoralis (strain ATCC 51850 / DSM 5473 / JCM 8560 / NS-C) TaxID=523849 RepID=H3ZKZ6_THELN|nr:tyrosine-type recombinase/integrase [Thermococcus litoralis]EHR79397.1 hypothetical protein OCC_08018 [Thermococcus litoralis DSM 5473]
MEHYEKWIETYFTSEHTQKTYLSALRQFHDKFGYMTTPDELLDAITTWIRDLRTEGYTPKTINNYVTAVLSYYRDQGIVIPEETWRRIRRRILPPSKPSTFDKAGSHDEWKRILTHMSLAGRSLFLFLLSTGCRIGEALQLKISDLDLEKDPPRAYIRPEYTKGGYGGRVVFFTYEARDAIEEWLKLRLILNKRAPKRYYIPKHGRYAYYTEKDDNRVWPISVSTAQAILWEALKRAGLDERDPRTGRRLIHIHSTRKFFRSNCGLPDALTHALMGHEGYLDRSYLRQNVERAGEEYKQIAIPRLTIFEKTTADKMEILKLIAKALGVNEERLDTVLEEHRGQGFYDIATAIGNLIKEEISKSAKKKEYAIVDEDELQFYLLNGWDLAKVLNDGRFLMVRA